MEAPSNRAYCKLRQKAYVAAILVALAFSVIHLVSLPIGITYDGYYYIDLADVLGSARFPADWHPIRTPLYPLSLKLSFWLLGIQPLAVILVSTVLGTTTVLLLGRIARLLGGEWCGVIVVLLVTFYPTAIAYEHLVLTEIGTSLFLVLLMTVAIWQIRTEADTWKQAAACSLILTIGYFWRQPILQLAPVAAVLWLAGAWKFFRGLGLPWKSRILRLTASGALILLLPAVLSHLWDPFIDRAGLTATILRQGIVRQALLAPDDPIVGRGKDMYVNAIGESLFRGNFFSGVRNDLFDPVLDQLFRSQPPRRTSHIFLHGIVSHPKRYVEGVARTLALFGGARAKVNENRIFREYILSPTWTGAKLADGPAAIEAKIKREFQQTTTTSAVARFLWNLCPLYDRLLIIANVVTAVGFIVALLLRDFAAMAISVFPLAYIGLYAVILASIDRFALPVYPITLADAVILPMLLWNGWKAHSHGRDTSQPVGSDEALDCGST
jgi:hypothetical protein